VIYRVRSHGTGALLRPGLGAACSWARARRAGPCCEQRGRGRWRVVPSNLIAMHAPEATSCVALCTIPCCCDGLMSQRQDRGTPYPPDVDDASAPTSTDICTEKCSASVRFCVRCAPWLPQGSPSLPCSWAVTSCTCSLAHAQCWACLVPDWHGATSARVCPWTQRAGTAARDTRVSLRALLTCIAPDHTVHAVMQLQAPPARAVADLRWLGQDRARCGSGSHAHALGARLHHGECVGARCGDPSAAN
jgi:hypothetical protein